MEQYRGEEIQEILAIIDRYLAAEIDKDDVAYWATLRLTDGTIPESPRQEEDYIIGTALGALMMLSSSEPEEFRTTREELLLARSYLLGDEPFPQDRIPKGPDNTLI